METIPLDFLGLIFLILLIITEAVYNDVKASAFTKLNSYSLKLFLLFVLCLGTLLCFIGIITKIIGLNFIQ